MKEKFYIGVDPIFETPKQIIVISVNTDFNLEIIKKTNLKKEDDWQKQLIKIKYYYDAIQIPNYKEKCSVGISQKMNIKQLIRNIKSVNENEIS